MIILTHLMTSKLNKLICHWINVFRCVTIFLLNSYWNIDTFLRYTVLCSSRLSYIAPKKEENWPKCVNACWRKLPPVPSQTGLAQQWIRPNKIPAGQFGHYRCTDPSLGMGPYISANVKEKGGSRNFYRSWNMQCLCYAWIKISILLEKQIKLLFINFFSG